MKRVSMLEERTEGISQNARQGDKEGREGRSNLKRYERHINKFK